MSTASVKRELEKYGLTPNRALGQNFLASDTAARTIAEAACENRCPVIEIGPGMGALTAELAQAGAASCTAAELAKRAPMVAAIEIDRRMAEIIADRLPEVQLINEDALKADIPGLIAALGGRANIAANLPYYITTPLCVRFLSIGADGGIPAMTLMMQKEAAERFTAKPGDRVYGPLTVLAGDYYEVTKLMELSRDMYYPQPDVDSVVLKLTAKGAEKLFELEWLLNRAFAMRRKTLSNNLRAAGISDERLKSLLGACGIEGNIRAEKLTVAQFANIAREIGAHGK